MVAHLNMTRFMGFLLTLLYSSRKFSTTSRILFTSNTSKYGLESFLGSTKSQNMRLRRSSSSTTPVWCVCVWVCVGGSVHVQACYRQYMHVHCTCTTVNISIYTRLYFSSGKVQMYTVYMFDTSGCTIFIEVQMCKELIKAGIKV